uniref:Transcription factor domain-containing protein n=1 Tax=Bionectria ochroleuca TaxID=29856 RepID=A0A8H7NQ78_BIOOC
MSLFITYVLVLGRSLESSRGLLELLTPALALEADDSPLSLSLHAAAIQLWCLINSRSFSSSDKILTQAYSRLRTAIQDPSQRSCESNVLAALLLQRYERFSAVWNQHEQCHVHRNGALALLRQQKLDGIQSKHRGYLISQLFHIEVNICISKKTPFQASEMTWLTDRDLSILPSNPSTALDLIGASIANHQHIFYLLSAEKFITASKQELSQWYEDLEDTENQLHSWPDSVPRHWLPQTLQSGKHFDQSIITYAGYSDIYPNIQIASIWNLWRTYCLVLLRIKLALLDLFPSLYELVGVATNSFQIHR